MTIKNTPSMDNSGLLSITSVKMTISDMGEDYVEFEVLNIDELHSTVNFNDLLDRVASDYFTNLCDTFDSEAFDYEDLLEELGDQDEDHVYIDLDKKTGELSLCLYVNPDGNNVEIHRGLPLTEAEQSHLKEVIAVKLKEQEKQKNHKDEIER